MSVREGFRPIETGVHTDFREAMSYANYLDLDTLLAASSPHLGNRRGGAATSRWSILSSELLRRGYGS